MHFISCISYKSLPITIHAARKIVTRAIEEFRKDKCDTLFDLSKMMKSNELYKNIFFG